VRPHSAFLFLIFPSDMAWRKSGQNGNYHAQGYRKYRCPLSYAQRKSDELFDDIATILLLPFLPHHRCV
jgi:hypothetical protein